MSSKTATGRAPGRGASALAPRRLLILLTCGWAGLATAQTVPAPPPGIGDALKSVQPPPAPVAPRPPAPVITTPPALPTGVAVGETLTVTTFQLDAIGPIAEPELQAALDAYRNRPLTMAEIDAAAAGVAARYHEHGYLLARVVVPRQDARAGVLRLRVVIGTPGAITLHNRSLVSDRVLLQAFAGVAADAAVTRASLERAMLIVGDSPGATLPRLTLTPGATAGATDLDVDIDASPRVSGHVVADNWGSRYTGRNRLGAELRIDSPLGIADRLTLDALGAQGGDLINGRIGYALPLSGDGLRAEVAVSKTTYQLGQEYAALGATGRAESAEGTLSYAWLRSRERSLTLHAGLAARQLRDEIDSAATAQPRRTNALSVGAQFEDWGGLVGANSATSAGAGVTWGRLSIHDAAQRATNEAGVDTVGSYAKLNVNLAAQWELPRGWTLGASALAQQVLNGRNLDPSEQLGLAGAAGVKAYREAVNGDNGVLATASARRALPGPDGLVHSLGPFVEAGRVRAEDGRSLLRNGTRLADVGLEYAARHGRLFARVQAAHVLGPRPDGTDSHQGSYRWLLQAGCAL